MINDIDDNQDKLKDEDVDKLIKDAEDELEDEDLDKLIKDTEDEMINAWKEYESKSIPPPPPPPAPWQFNTYTREPQNYNVEWNNNQAYIDQSQQHKGGMDLRQKMGFAPKAHAEVFKYYGNTPEYKEHMESLNNIPDEQRKATINTVNDSYADIIREIKDYIGKTNFIADESFVNYVQNSNTFRGNYAEVVEDISQNKKHRLYVHEGVFNIIKSERDSKIEKENKKKEKMNEDKERAILCEWLSREMPIKNDEDAAEAFYLARGNLNRNFPEQVREYEQMAQLYRKYERRGNICPQGSESWALFMSRISTGIYSNNHPEFKATCFALAIFMMLYLFSKIFGSPIKFKDSKNKTTTNNTYEDGNNICRNRIRTLGNGYAIDSCYRPTDLSKYILDDNYRNLFYESYIDLRKKGRNAYDACTVSFKRIDQQLDMKYNYKMDIENKEGLITDTVEIKGCSFFNDFFAEGVKRPCRTKRITKKFEKRNAEASWWQRSSKTEDGEESKGWWGNWTESRQKKNKENQERAILCKWLSETMPIENDYDAAAAFEMAKANVNYEDEREVAQFERMSNIYNKYKDSDEGIVCKLGFWERWGWGKEDTPPPAPAPAPKKSRKKRKKEKKKRKEKKQKQKQKKQEKKTRKKIKKAFCFAPNTRVLMSNGQYKYIQQLNVGDMLWDNNMVEGTMTFTGKNADLVINSGIVSTYDHHILHNGQFIKSGNVPGSQRLSTSVDYLFDIDTSNHRIIILNNNNQPVTYTDYTEVDDTTGKVYEYELDLLNYEHSKKLNAI